ncbi:MAG: hypothetical protein P8012_00095 [Desulfobacterales bacterium]
MNSKEQGHLTTEEILNNLANAIQQYFKDMGIDTGFALLTFDFGGPGTGNYVSNADLDDMILALRETADKLERHQDIPRTKNKLMV